MERSEAVVVSSRQEVGSVEYFVNGKSVLTLDAPRAAPIPEIKPYPDLNPDIFPNAVSKVLRAREHLDSIDQELDAFFRRSVLDFRERVTDVDYIFEVRLCEDIPSRLATIVSDHLSNLRSALNLLVCDLIRLNGREPSRKNQFPASRSKLSFKRECDDRLFGLSERSKRFFSLLRPYAGGIDLFWELSQVRNTSEHNFVLPVLLGGLKVNVRASIPGVYGSQGGGISLGGPLTGFSPIGHLSGCTLPRGAREVECVLGSYVEIFSAPKEILGLQMEIQPQVTILVGREVGSLLFLGRCHYLVSRVVDVAQKLRLR